MIFLIVGLLILGSTIVGAISSVRYRARRRERVRNVELAAAEAADDDPAFRPDRVRGAAERLFSGVQAAWDARDRERLEQLIGPELLVEWNRRLDDFEMKGWHNRVEVVGAPQVEYVGLVNRSEDEADRAVVRIEATLHDYVLDVNGNRLRRNQSGSEMTSLCEYWTLGKRGGGWFLLSIEQRAEGDYQLSEELIASPWADTERLRDDSLVEGAVADKPPEGFESAELADLDFDGDARAAALDLSLADPRFAPDVLEAAARRAVAAWAEAVDGPNDQLLELASPAAVRELLHPGDPSERTRLVVRGPRIRHVRVTGIDAAATPPTMTIDVAVSGRRYVEDRDTAAMVSGSQSTERTFTERWTLALDGPDSQPWRIVHTAAESPASRRAAAR